MKKEDIIKCLQEATIKNITEKGVEWKLLFEDGADAILKLAAQPDVIKSVCDCGKEATTHLCEKCLDDIESMDGGG